VGEPSGGEFPYTDCMAVSTPESVKCAEELDNEQLCRCVEGKVQFWSGNCVKCAERLDSGQLCRCVEGKVQFWREIA
jgi:predicted amidophosphoribosyltransferase